MARQNKDQGNSQGQSGEFSKQIDSDMRERMKGEHSLQIDHDAESFHQGQQGEPGQAGRSSSSRSAQSGTGAQGSNAEQSASDADFTKRKVGDADSAPGGG